MTGITFEESYFPNAMIAHADAALGALKCFEKGKVGFINCAIDVVPECDCFPWAGLAICPDVGIFASKDLVAIEEATLDAIDKAPWRNSGGTTTIVEHKTTSQDITPGSAYWG